MHKGAQTLQSKQHRCGNSHTMQLGLLAMMQAR